MREQEFAALSTFRRRMAALSSKSKHLVREGVASRDSVVTPRRRRGKRQLAGLVDNT